MSRGLEEVRGALETRASVAEVHAALQHKADILEVERVLNDRLADKARMLRSPCKRQELINITICRKRLSASIAAELDFSEPVWGLVPWIRIS